MPCYPLEIDGYAASEKRGSVVYWRSLVRDNQSLSWTIDDEISGGKTCRLVWSFFLGDQVDFERISRNQINIMTEDGGIEFHLMSSSLELVLEKSDVIMIRVRGVFRLPIKVQFHIKWKEGMKRYEKS